MEQHYLYKDRCSAGKKLALLVEKEIERLKNQGITTSILIYALPRGGIPIAIPIASKLRCPIDVLIAKKITTSDNQELAIGAVTDDGCILWSEERFWQKLGFSKLKKALKEALVKAKEQVLVFAPYRPQVKTQNGIAIIVDDGIATGMTIKVAVESMRKKQAAQVWICVPVAPRDLLVELEKWADCAIVLDAPYPFYNVSRFYQEFEQVETETALFLLKKHNRDYFPINNNGEGLTPV